MKRPLILSVSAAFLLIGAAYPDQPKLGYSMDVAAADEADAPVRYRPCRPGPGDDRCIQLYERGVRLAYARWLRGKDDREDEVQLARGGPYQQAAPLRHRTDTAVRCVDPANARDVRGM